MSKYKSDFKYIPSTEQSPCWFKKECSHKQETMGMCRFECIDYIKYQNLKNAQYSENRHEQLVTNHQFNARAKARRIANR